MAHNQTGRKVLQDVLATPLAHYQHWNLEVACASNRCPCSRVYSVARLMAGHPAATVGEVLRRLRCVTCRHGVATAALVEVSPGLRIPLRGSDIRL